MSRNLYLFAEPKVLGQLVSAGLRFSRAEGARPEPGRSIGFERDKAGRLHGHVDYLKEGFAFDPWKQPQSAILDRPVRVQVERLAEPSQLSTALGWWPRLLDARNRSGVQADAGSDLDATVLILEFELNPQQRLAIADASRTRPIYLIGPQHRATPGGEVKQAIHTWPVEVARLVVGLQAAPGGRVVRAGLHAWSSLEFELGARDGKGFVGSRRELGATIGRLLRPDGIPWNRGELPPSTMGEVLSVKPTFATMPVAFEYWPVTSGEPAFIRDRVRIDSAPWSEARAGAGRLYRAGQDDRDVAKAVGGFGERDDGEAARAFGSVRTAKGLERLRGIAGATIRSGDARAVTDEVRSLETGWSELLARVHEARSHENELGGCAKDLSEARSHLPAFRWRLFVVGAVTMFVGGLVAFSLGRMGGLLGSATWWVPGVCIAAAVGSLVGAFGVWWGEMTSGNRALGFLRSRAEEQEARIKRAYESAGSLVAGGAAWWRDWRFHGNARAIRLTAKRLESIIGEVAREESEEGPAAALAGETGRHKSESTVRLVGDGESPDLSRHSSVLTDLSNFRSLDGDASRAGAVISREFAEEMRSRIREYRDSVLRNGQVAWKPDPQRFEAGLREARTLLAGSHEHDSPGLSVVTLRNPGNPVRPFTLVAVVEPIRDALRNHGGAEILQDTEPEEMPRTLAADGVVVRIIRIHLGDDRTGWSEGEPADETGEQP